MISVEERRAMLASIAIRYAGWRYEVDELINEAWLRKSVRKAQHPAFVFIAGRSAMIDYMRSQQGRRDRKRYWLHPLFTDAHQSEETHPSNEPIVFPFDEVEFKDDLERICQGMTREHKLITRMLLAGGTQKQAARAIGLTESRISQIWQSLRARIRIQYEISHVEAIA